ncbi:prephenate dehydratase [Candidatus Parcubacteria bacterium]|nr:prephenate dehydratase [Candidatus Parcubacteria bacterium]
MSDSDLEKIRKEIDGLDSKILDLLNDRARLALKIKKTSTGKTPIRPEREIEIVRRLSDINNGPLTTDAVRSIFTQIISSFRDQLQLDRPISVGYLGPEGTYSQEAALKLFGNTVQLHPEETISAVFRAVQAGTTQLAVVPIENSSEGAVRETHSLLLKTDVNIVSEISVPVAHCLLSKDKDLSSIKRVYAHPQALGQCRTWLATHLPSAIHVPQKSNASAAQMAANTTEGAAIAPKKAAEIYGLNILETAINDQPDNETRFIALGNLKTKPTGSDKTSMICVAKDKPGALYQILGVLAEGNISMTRLESQPYEQGQYAFYIDFVGHRDDESVKLALEKIDGMTRICKVLGSYPAELNKK